MPAKPSRLCAAWFHIVGFVLTTAPTYAADNYPSRPIRMIVPGAAGGPTDIAARLLAQKLTDTWQQQVIVDNRIGGNGIIAQQMAARSAPDGYTLLVNGVAFAINPSLYKLPYDSRKDFTPVTLLASSPLMLVIHPSVKAQSVEELVSLARAKPGSLNYASFGNGSVVHLGCEMLKTMTGIRIAHVPYRGVTQALTEVMSGQVQVMLVTIPTAMPQIGAGRITGLAVTSKQRSSLAPAMPTMIEAGVPGYELTTWFGTYLPSGTPRAALSKLHGEISRIMATPDVKGQMDKQGFDTAPPNSPEEFARFLRAETEKFAKIIKAAGVKVD